MRVFAVTPIHVGADELRRRQARYDRLAPEPLRIVLHDLPADAPRGLDTPGDVRRSERYVAEALAAAPAEEYQAAFADCVLDPGVQAAAVGAAVPVYGLLRLAGGFIAGTGRRFGAVTRNEPISREFQRMVGHYGLSDQFTRVEVLDLDFDAIADDQLWNDRLAAAVTELAAQGAEIVVNGCSAVDLQDLPHGVVVMDPTLVALRMLGLGAATGSLPGGIAA
jgi:Asp/Glu/hydantoin racemase